MRSTSAINKPSFVNDLGSLAGLYRTVFWMIGRKAQYGRIWPREADMGPGVDVGPDEPLVVPPSPPVTSFEAPPASPVEAGTRD
jgi:hypothetical protein